MPARRKRTTRRVGGPPRIKAWSFSRWSTYEECPAKAKYAYLDRLPQPDSPALARGQEVHAKAEGYVRGTIAELPSEFDDFASDFAELKKELDVAVEEEWAFTSDWEPTGWFEKGPKAAWCRVKVDARVRKDDGAVVKVIDHKTGRVYPYHDKQMELYALGALLMFPTAEVVETELWYLDQGKVDGLEFSATERDELIATWEDRVRPMLTDTTFGATPSPKACRFCPFAKSRGGPCDREHRAGGRKR